MDKLSKLSADLTPYLDLNIASAALDVVNHTLNGSHHTGLLDDAQAPQFFKHDGSRIMTGSITLNPGLTVDGVDISEHVQDSDAHHVAFVGLWDNNWYVANPDTASKIRLFSTDGLTVEKSGEYALNFKVDGTVVRTTRSIIAGAGLAGGGLLSSDVTIDIVSLNSGLIANTDTLEINVNEATGLSLNGGIAINYGDGLTVETNILKVNASDLDGKGLVVTNNNLDIGLPSNVSAASSNSVGVSTHTHGVEAKSNPGVESTLLKTDSQGNISFNNSVFIRGDLQSLWVNSGVPDGSAAFKVTATNPNSTALYVQQVENQVLPIIRFKDYLSNDLLLLTKDGDLESGKPGFVSGVTGWSISPNGNAEFNNLTARGSLHSSIFVYDEVHAQGGTMMVLEASVLKEDVVVL